jgi:uncharacterized protein (TIGR03083 family)
MTLLADKTIAALRDNHASLATEVGNLAEADLARQSACSDWDVAQVLSHLGSGAEIALATLRAGTAGGEPLADDFNQSVWDRWNAMDRQQQAEGFLDAGERLVSTFESLDATARRDLRVKLPFLPSPTDIAVFAGMRLNEAVLHAWDVRVAFDPQAAVTGQEAGVALEQLAGPLAFLIGFLGKPESLGHPSAALRVETTDPEHVFGLVLSPAVSLNGAPRDTDGVLTGPAEAFLRLLAGRLDPEHTPGDLTLTSDTLTLDQLRGVFPGI